MQPACACAARVPGRNCREKHGIIYGLGCDFHFLCWPLFPRAYTHIVLYIIYTPDDKTFPTPLSRSAGLGLRRRCSLPVRFFFFYYYLKTNRKKKSINSIWTSRARYMTNITTSHRRLTWTSLRCLLNFNLHHSDFSRSL